MSQCSQRIYLLKLLRDKGFCLKKLNIVFQSIIISRLSYAISAWEGFLSSSLVNKIDAFLKGACRYNFCLKPFSMLELLGQADFTLFKKIQDVDSR